MDLNGKNESDGKNRETLRRIINIGCDWEKFDFRPVHGSVLSRPWMNGKKFVSSFAPEKMADLLWARAELSGRVGEVASDMSFLIALGVEVGDDMSKNALALTPFGMNKFQQLRNAYGLRPSAAANDYDVLTLSRLCWLFPTITCSYIHTRPAVPWPRCSVATPERMAAISPGYPPVMMTQSFAFLVPNRNEAYCMHLLKALMLHEYEVMEHSVNAVDTSGPDDHRDKVIVYVVKCTLARVVGSWIPHDKQMEFLKRLGLVRSVGEPTADNKLYVVEGNVAAAVRMWDLKDKKRLTDQFIKLYR